MTSSSVRVGNRVDIIVYASSMPLWYMLSVTERSKYNAMEMANRFHETGLFLYAEPDLMEDIKINCVSDPVMGKVMLI